MPDINPEKLSNQALFQAYQRLAQSPAAANYDESRKAVLNKILGRFRYSGIDLPLINSSNFRNIRYR